MPPLFLDTSGWLAAIDVQEPRHRDAKELYTRTLRDGVTAVTTNLVVAEMHAMVLKRCGPAEALAVLEDLALDLSHEVVFVDRELHRAAIERWIRPFRDQVFSLTDAVSFEVMRQRRLRRALALDHHFITAGFEIL